MSSTATRWLLVLSTNFLIVRESLPSRTHCGAHIINSRGHISTPNFPQTYPVPISCEWVIEAPPGHKVAIYFTQYYMKKGFTASDYTYYSRRIHSGVGRFDFGPISSVDEPTYLVSNQRVLVLNLNVRSVDNIHLRVREHLLDVSGFNVTYEVIPRNGTIREDACIYHHCSFTGYCYASVDYSTHICACFEGYFGEECQYDDACGPNSASEVCQNGGTCRYYIGSSVRTCECLPGYKGAKCDLLISSNKTNEISDLKCKEIPPTSKDYVIIYPWNKMCYDKDDLLIQRLEISESMPVIEGVPLQIACIVTGDLQTNVVWLKDGFPIAFEASQGRLWHMTVPPDTNGRQAFLLGLDWTNELDTGVFTCDARDGTRNEQISIQVTIRSVSGLLIEPLAATVPEGGSINITCVFKGALYRSSAYSWKKMDHDLHLGRDVERVEDLYPVGTRLLLPKASQSVNYTCLSRTTARVIRHSSVITVVNATEFSTSTCRQERTNGVRWKVTAIGATDIHACPSGYTGYIQRRCAGDLHRSGEWEKPDFSTCFSAPILAIKKEFDSRKMGYRRKSVQELLEELHDFLSLRHDAMHHSEGEQIVDMLYHADSSFHTEASEKDNWNKVLKIASFLFHSDLVHKQHEQIKLIFLVRNISLACARKTKLMDVNEQFESRCLRVDITTTMQESPLYVYIPWCLRNSTQCNSMHLKIDSSGKPRELLGMDSSGNASVAISTIVYRCLELSEVHEFRKRDGSLEDHAPIFSVDVTIAAFEQVITKVQTTITYPVILNMSSNDKIHCLQFILHERLVEKRNCQLIGETLNNSYCRCNGTGLFSFVINPYTDFIDDSHRSVNAKLLITIIGCTVFLFIILLIALKAALRIKENHPDT